MKRLTRKQAWLRISKKYIDDGLCVEVARLQGGRVISNATARHMNEELRVLLDARLQAMRIGYVYLWPVGTSTQHLRHQLCRVLAYKGLKAAKQFVLNHPRQ